MLGWEFSRQHAVQGRYGLRWAGGLAGPLVEELVDDVQRVTRIKVWVDEQGCALPLPH